MTTTNTESAKTYCCSQELSEQAPLLRGNSRTFTPVTYLLSDPRADSNALLPGTKNHKTVPLAYIQGVSIFTTPFPTGMLNFDFYEPLRFDNKQNIEL